MTLDDEVRAGQNARMVLDNPAFQSAVKTIEEALLLGIRQSAFKDEDLREKLCHRFALLHDLVGQIQTVMETGQMAEEQIKRLSISEKVKEFFQ